MKELFSVFIVDAYGGGELQPYVNLTKIEVANLFAERCLDILNDKYKSLSSEDKYTQFFLVEKMLNNDLFKMYAGEDSYGYCGVIYKHLEDGTLSEIKANYFKKEIAYILFNISFDMEYDCWLEYENMKTERLFDLKKILDLQLKHDVQLIRGSDYQYMCYIDGKVYATGLTPLFALVHGLNMYKTEI